MKRIILASLVVPLSAGISVAQKSDVLGAHANYGHGCLACHFNHIQSEEPGRVATITARDTLLWGDEASMLPAESEAASLNERTGMLVCLSCHDGNYAPPAMMKNRIYESVPEAFGAAYSVPTLMDKPRVTTGVDMDAHPVGEAARMDCDGGAGWDCTLTQDGLRMTGIRSAHFASTYGYFVKPRRSGSSAVVMCTTCHNPHLMSVVNVAGNAASKQYPAGAYATRYFLRAPYYSGTPADGGNQSAQFCRECHADKSNEMNGKRPG